jgi:hypothetical protein
MTHEFSMMKIDKLPDFIFGDRSNALGVTDMPAISRLGADQFISSDPRYKRRTFALRIGYHGSQFQVSNENCRIDHTTISYVSISQKSFLNNTGVFIFEISVSC